MTTSSHPAPGCRRLERQRRRERRRPIPAHIRQRNDTVLQHLGLAHLGAIGGYTMSLVVAGSALGPYSFTLSLGGIGGDELQNFNHNLYVESMAW